MSAFDMKDFARDVIEPCKTIPVVVDFWAPWCGPCRTLGPVLEKLAGEAKGKWKLVKLNTDEFPQISAQFGIKGIPNVKMVYQGKVIAEFSGAYPEAAVRQWLAQNLPADVADEELEEEAAPDIGALLATGDRETPRKIITEQVRADSSNKDLRAKLAMLVLPKGLPDAKLLMKDLDESKFEIERETVATMEWMLGLNNNGIPATATGTVETLFKQGLGAFDQENWEVALDSFIQVMMRDRAYLEDGARRMCVAIFALLTENHPITKKWRRRFSMALY